MPSTKAHTDLELPPFSEVDAGFQRSLNDSLRQIARQLDGIGTATAQAVNRGSSAGTQLILTAPGTLAIMSSVTPLVSVANMAAPMEVLAYLKQPAQGGSVTLQVNADGAKYFALTIPQGQTKADQSGGNFAQIAAGAVISVDITGVGGTFPGADLTVILRF
jgi:hypothetical protein